VGFSETAAFKGMTATRETPIVSVDSTAGSMSSDYGAELA
jgi:hypothetical protein